MIEFENVSFSYKVNASEAGREGGLGHKVNASEGGGKGGLATTIGRTYERIRRTSLEPIACWLMVAYCIRW